MREARRHGDALMPVMNYCIRREDSFHALDCHWHSEMELFRVMQGTLPNVLPAPYVGLVLATIVNGVGGGLIEVIISPIVDSCPGDAKASAMSLLHSFYCWDR